MSDSQPISLLQRREIEARIVGPIFRAFAAEIGLERTREILARVVRELAREAGRAAAVDGNSTRELAAAVDRWREGDALALTVLRQDAEALDFDVTRCGFAEMYRRLGLEDLGPILSCGRDEAVVEGFNSDLELHRSRTILEGAACCDFRFRRRAAAASDSTPGR